MELESTTTNSISISIGEGQGCGFCGHPARIHAHDCPERCQGTELERAKARRDFGTGYAHGSHQLQEAPSMTISPYYRFGHQMGRTDALATKLLEQRAKFIPLMEADAQGVLDRARNSRQSEIQADGREPVGSPA